MDISPQLLEQIVTHALADPENEVCGLVAVTSTAKDDGPAQATRIHRATNKHASPLRFEIDGKEVLRTMDEFEGEGWDLGAIYHSHVRSKPYPSQTDINFARNWPGIEWIIVGLAPGQSPEVRSYLIDGGEVTEVAI